MSILKNLVADAVDEVRSVISRNLGEPLTIAADRPEVLGDAKPRTLVPDAPEPAPGPQVAGQGGDADSRIGILPDRPDPWTPSFDGAGDEQPVPPEGGTSADDPAGTNDLEFAPVSMSGAGSGDDGDDVEDETVLALRSSNEEPRPGDGGQLPGTAHPGPGTLLPDPAPAPGAGLNLLGGLDWDVLAGGDAADVIMGGGGSEEISGGGDDVYVVNGWALFGDDVIDDTDGFDELRFEGMDLFAEVAQVVRDGADLVFTYSAGGSLRIADFYDAGAIEKITYLGAIYPTNGNAVTPETFAEFVTASGDMISDGDRAVVDLRIDPKDVDAVYPGMAARLRLTAFNPRTTPRITGRVTRVSADRMADPQTGATYFTGRVVPEMVAESAPDAEPPTLKPGCRRKSLW